jgi:hypothetical protein
VQSQLTALANASLLTINVDRLSAAIRNQATHLPTLWRHFGHKWHRRLAFTAKVRIQSATDTIINTIIGTDHRRVAFVGHAGNTNGPRGAAMPVVRIKAAIARHGRLVTFNEDYTTIICSSCHCRMFRSSNNWKTFHCNKCSRSVNRDANAAANGRAIIVAHLSRQRRPKHLTRSGNKMKTTRPKSLPRRVAPSRPSPTGTGVRHILRMDIFPGKKLN